MKERVIFVFLFLMLVSFSMAENEKWVRSQQTFNGNKLSSFSEGLARINLQNKSSEREDPYVKMIGYLDRLGNATNTILTGYAYPNGFSKGVEIEATWNVNTNIWKTPQIRNGWDWLSKSIQSAGALVAGIGMLVKMTNPDTDTTLTTGIGVSITGVATVLDLLFPLFEKNKIVKTTGDVISEISSSRTAFDMTKARAEKVKSFDDKFSSKGKEIDSTQNAIEKIIKLYKENPAAMEKVEVYYNQIKTEFIPKIEGYCKDFLIMDKEFMSLLDGFEMDYDAYNILNTRIKLDADGKPVLDQNNQPVKIGIAAIDALDGIKKQVSEVKDNYRSFFPSVIEDPVLLNHYVLDIKKELQ